MVRTAAFSLGEGVKVDIHVENPTVVVRLKFIVMYKGWIIR